MATDDPRDPDAPAPGAISIPISIQIPPASPDPLASAREHEPELGTPSSAPADAEPPAGDDALSPSGGTPPPSSAVPNVPPRVAPPPSARPRGSVEPEEIPVEVPRGTLARQSRRDFLLFGLGVAAAAVGAWWLLPDPTKARLLPGAGHDRLDTWLARAGLTHDRRERALDRALTFDDDVAEALYSKDRRVRTYSRSEVTPLRNNYDGQTPGPEYLSTWTLSLSGLASGRVERLSIEELLSRFALREQVTRLVCVEGWSAVAWWGGIRFADLLAAFPPVPGARWAGLRSAVNLDFHGNPDPYYVSIDLPTAMHPQTLLATHHDGRPLTVAHGAPMRLLAPMKLGLKNIKAVTDIAYSAAPPPDYWNARGYSKYDGL